MPFPGFWLVEKFVSFHDETKIQAALLSLKTIPRFQNSAAAHPTVCLQEAYQSESDQILQKVRKDLFAEFSAFPQFVKVEKYSNILLLSTIFTTLIELRIIWPFGLELKHTSPFTVVWLNKSNTIWMTLAKSIAATAKLGILAIKTRNC